MFKGDFTAQLVSIIMTVVLFILFIAIFAVFVYMLFQWFKHRNREKVALEFVTLLVRVPKDNETKIDAAEQLFASLYTLKKSGFFSWAQAEDLFSFELVALQEEISFYMNCPKRIRDLVEKQIHGAYPNADIKETDEVNIFSKKGKVAFNSIKLDKSTFLPIKLYKDLPTDGLSLLTSALSKMGPGEGAIVQILLQPESKRVGSKKCYLY